MGFERSAGNHLDLVCALHGDMLALEPDVHGLSADADCFRRWDDSAEMLDYVRWLHGRQYILRHGA